jgi:alpha-galactosidase
MQVTIIGGGSYQWGPKLIADLLGTPSLAGMELVLEDVDATAASALAAYAERVVEKMGAKATVTATTDQRRALDGADYVVVTISTGGFATMAVDLDVPARHGIVQSVGDSVGPGGINRALRNIPVLLGIARDMEECCPEAWMLNITNPMTCLTRVVARETSVPVVGLCHEVENFCMDLAIAFGKPHTVVRPVVTGVNHFPVITELEIDGDDGFVLLEAMVDELGGLDALRPDPERSPAPPFSKLDFALRHLLKLSILERYRALPGAGDRHLAEFWPSVLTEESDWGRSWGIEPTPVSARQHDQDTFVAEVGAVLAGEAEPPTWPSGELVAPVIDSLLTGTRREAPVNIPNAGQCPDLPAQAVVESMCVVEADRITGRDAARAPGALAELLRRHVAVQELTVEAAVSGDRRLAAAALGLDPLAGRLDWRVQETMLEELLAGTADWLPQFAS